MLRLGLTTVTFNSLPTEVVADFCKTAELDVVEWGGRTHALSGDVGTAEEIKRLSLENGITVSSYGSYYRCGTYEDAVAEFSKHIAVAKTIGAPTIRIWVGNRNLEDASADYVDKIIEELKLISDMAVAEGIDIGCEFHGGTLTNNRENSLYIVSRVERKNFGMYFQYDPKVSVEENCKTLESFIPVLKNVHVFLVTEKSERKSLSEPFGKELWQRFISILKSAGVDANLILEFLPDPTLETLIAEVKAMRSYING